MSDLEKESTNNQNDEYNTQQISKLHTERRINLNSSDKGVHCVETQ